MYIECPKLIAMDELFKLDPRHEKNAVLELLMEIHAIESTNLQMLAELQSKIFELPIKEVQNQAEKYRAMRKAYIRDHIFEHFGKLDDDALK